MSVSKLVTNWCCLLLLLSLSSCTKSASPYDRLCRIYEDVRGQPSTPDLAVTVAKRVENEIPEIAEDYGFLANVNVGERYELLRMLARDKANQQDWHCEEIRKWYPPGQARP